MRLTKKEMKNRCSQPREEVEYLNISGLNLDVIEHLGRCENLHWLIASDNNLQSDAGISRLRQLWYLDLGNNQIQNLYCLSNFLALGTLILSNNNLKWTDLERLSHAHIMSLSLHGNPQLDSDPYYRIHVIDCLPLIWELDGRLVTVTERLHVKQFFIDTQYTEHPVRHKTCKTFQTTKLRNIGTEGIVSKKCKYIFSKFPMSEKHTKHTDERRLKYLANMVQQDIVRMQEESGDKLPFGKYFLDRLMGERHKDVERCNMVLLLLVISLEFQMPTGLIRASLVTAQLDMIGSFGTMNLFLLPRDHRSRVTSVLLNAAKVDRDNHVKHEGGLYPQLFMCLYYTVAQLTRIRQASQKNMKKIKPISQNSDFMALIASEAVSLMIRNTKFFNYFTVEHGVVALVTAATGSVNVVLDSKDKLLEAESMMVHKGFTSSWNNTFTADSVPEVHTAVTKLIVESIEDRLSKINLKMSTIPVGDRYLSLSDSLPIKPLHSVIWASTFLSKGQQVPRTDPPILRPQKEALKPKAVQPKMEDKVLLGPQVVGELTMLMEGNIAMARIDQVPVANGAVVSKLRSSDAHFTFVDMKSLCFDRDISMWRPVKSVGDNLSNPPEDESRYSIQFVGTKPEILCEKEELRNDIGEDYQSSPLIYTPRVIAKNRPFSSARMQKSPVSRGMMRRRVLSANFNSSNNQQTRIDANKTLSFNKTDPSSSLVSQSNSNLAVVMSKTKAESSMSLSLHQHDNIHYIQGLTPRDDSSRSGSISAPTARPQHLVAACMEDDGANSPTMAADLLKELQIPERDKQQIDSARSMKDEADAHTESSNPDTVAAESDVEKTMQSRQDKNQNDDVPEIKEVTSHGHSHRDVDDIDEINNDDVETDEDFGDNCPICIAAASGTFLRMADSGQTLTTSHTDQGMAVEIPQVTKEEDQSSAKVQEICKDTASENTENITPAENLDPKTPTQPNGFRNPTGVSQVTRLERPKSAMESYNYYVIHQPQGVFASGTSARINERNTNTGFTTHFQQQREDAWKRTTRNRHQRPLTATIMNTSQPLQRPPSSGMYRNINPHFKVTQTDGWLGGGRDLYWESVRKRPKSGHTPGWKEGLPESMRKKRPASAYVMSSMPQSYTSRSVTPNFRPSDVNYNSSFPEGFGPEDSMLFTPLTHAIQLLPEENQSRQLTTPVSDDKSRLVLEP